jgi:IMP dehydrogenase/GMP reductase
MDQGYELSDVLIVPKHSNVISRGDADLSVDLGKLKLQIPIVASPMEGIVGVKIIKELGEMGGLGILHRFYNNEDKRVKDVNILRKSNVNFGVAVGLGDPFYMCALNNGANVICIDVANGYLQSVLDFTNSIAKYIKVYGYDCLVMSGTVATYEGARDLANSGTDIVRVGLGSGNLCVTRRNTGIGVPQYTALKDCTPKGYYQNWFVMADGGIKDSGTAVKALGAGGDILMLGSLFGNCKESEHNGKIRGMASREFQEQFYGEVKKSVEGIQKKAKKKYHLKEFVEEFTWNMRSSFTYLNSRTISELQSNTEFILAGSGSIQ